MKFIVAVIALVGGLSLSFLWYEEIANFPPLAETRQYLDFAGSSLGQYYENYENKYISGRHKAFDRYGVPLYKFAGEFQYHPVYISQFALGALEYYLNSGEQEAEQAFFNSANWLKNNLRKHGEFYYWEYTIEYTLQGGSIKPPWFSAMAQGQGASVLLRAYSMTGDQSYLNAAGVALRSLFFDLSMGGISVVKGEDYVFPQEYPSLLAADVLNGAISAYLGVYDYYRVTHDPDIKRLNDSILRTLANALPRYDAGYWSFYGLQPMNLAHPHYHVGHINQLEILYLISKNSTFLEYSQRFKHYYEDIFARARFLVMNHVRQVRSISGIEGFQKLFLFLTP